MTISNRKDSLISKGLEDPRRKRPVFERQPDITSHHAETSYERQSGSPNKRSEKQRNLIAFWILGMCNNFGYVVMLSAAFDLLHKDFHRNGNTQVEDKNSTNGTGEPICNPTSTGAILLPNILPALCIKLIAPFITWNVTPKIVIVIFLSALSFIMTALSIANPMTFCGVAICSLASGLGETTLLSFSCHYHRNVVSTWSSGTGAAGVAGALSYASLSYLMNARQTLLLMLLSPVLMTIAYFFILDYPAGKRPKCIVPICTEEEMPMIEDDDLPTNNGALARTYTFREKILLIKPLLKYMIPLFVVYFAEYLINQGLMELLYFRNDKEKIPHSAQYRWFQTTYQIGVLISRSSVNLFRIKAIWVLPILQMTNVVVLFLQVYYSYITAFWIAAVIILCEGLIGGSTYVNAFYEISNEIPEEDREYSMAITSLADATGIALAGAIALPVHDALCKLPAYLVPA